MNSVHTIKIISLFEVNWLLGPIDIESCRASLLNSALNKATKALKQNANPSSQANILKPPHQDKVFVWISSGNGSIFNSKWIIIGILNWFISLIQKYDLHNFSPQLCTNFHYVFAPNLLHTKSLFLLWKLYFDRCRTKFSAIQTKCGSYSSGKLL